MSDFCVEKNTKTYGHFFFYETGGVRFPLWPRCKPAMMLCSPSLFQRTLSVRNPFLLEDQINKIFFLGYFVFFVVIRILFLWKKISLI